MYPGHSGIWCPQTLVEKQKDMNKSIVIIGVVQKPAGYFIIVSFFTLVLLVRHTEALSSGFHPDTLFLV